MSEDQATPQPGGAEHHGRADTPVCRTRVSGPPTGRDNLVPPEDSFWTKYSSNHEVPISAGASIVLHMFLLLVVPALLALAGIGLWDSNREPPAVDNIIFAGGGGPGEGGGDSNASELKEVVPFDPEQQIESPLTYKPEDIAKLNDPSATRTVEQAKAAAQQAKGIADAARRVGEAGKGGPGTAGGKGSGKGPGEGSGEGPGKETKRSKRKDRWEMRFSFNSAEEYVRQIAKLQAILVVPEGDKYRVFEDPNNKSSFVKTQQELGGFGRIWFMTKERAPRDAVRAVLGLNERPRFVALFIPQSLEAELLKQELAYRGLSEDQIEDQRLATAFRVDRQGEEWKVEVIEQQPRRN